VAEGKPLWQVFEEEERRMGSYAMLGVGWTGKKLDEPTRTVTTTGSTSGGLSGSTVVYYPTTTIGLPGEDWQAYTVPPPEPIRFEPFAPTVFPAPAEVAPPPARLDDFMADRGGERLIDLD